MYEVVFVLKASKFCNLRCGYCYEHRELHVRENISAATLERLFCDIDRFGDHLCGLGVSPQFSFVWHGGEPLLLSPGAYAAIVTQQQAHIRKYPFRNSVQTNLYGNVKAALAFVTGRQWALGVSIDFADGIRTNAAGRESNASVIAAAEDLQRSGVGFGVISVLGSHNRDALPQAYDWVSRHAASWRILPVFDGGPEQNIAALRLPDEEVERVFVEIFETRATAPRHIPVAPLDGYLKSAALKIAGVRANAELERDILDNVFLLNVNGDVFTRPFAYDPAFCMGNINTASMTEMIEGEAYRTCQRVMRRRKAANCVACGFKGYCDLSPIHENGSLSRDGEAERCVFPRRTMQEIENELFAAGVDGSTIGGWARDWLSAPGVARLPPG